MIWADNAIIALLAIYTLIGVMRGFSQEVFSIIVWIIGIIVAWFFSQDFSIWLVKFFGASLARLAASFAVLIVITLTMGGIINILLADAVKKTGLTFIDRLGGMLLGGVHGLVVVFAIVVMAGLTPLPKDRWWQESKYIPPFQSLASLVKGNIPSIVASSINYR